MTNRNTPKLVTFAVLVSAAFALAGCGAAPADSSSDTSSLASGDNSNVDNSTAGAGTDTSAQDTSNTDTSDQSGGQTQPQDSSAVAQTQASAPAPAVTAAPPSNDSPAAATEGYANMQTQQLSGPTQLAAAGDGSGQAQVSGGDTGGTASTNPSDPEPSKMKFVMGIEKDEYRPAGSNFTIPVERGSTPLLDQAAANSWFTKDNVAHVTGTVFGIGTTLAMSTIIPATGGAGLLALPIIGAGGALVGTTVEHAIKNFGTDTTQAQLDEYGSDAVRNSALGAAFGGVDGALFHGVATSGLSHAAQEGMKSNIEFASHLTQHAAEHGVQYLQQPAQAQ